MLLKILVFFFTIPNSCCFDSTLENQRYFKRINDQGKHILYIALKQYQNVLHRGYMDAYIWKNNSQRKSKKCITKA
jgi:hypothetical protein